VAISDALPLEDAHRVSLV